MNAPLMLTIGYTIAAVAYGGYFAVMATRRRALVEELRRRNSAESR
jgi:hypothetical protein